ncbi:hypothetical protein PsorP6_014862 [Peronosclerospora sorghi]|uniref:Uncharacterized protein n=1 Tax=Peronosclerospora sorghi TaxID=230839 RepID=A0ACC0VT78_9STRA|nr:hypothetical protein PsorP6_014862 [Peronosclerospora sorghi]
MTTFLEDMGGFVSDRMQHAEQASMENLAKNLSKGLLNLIAGLDEVVAERNSLNGVSLDVLPAVLPHELVTLNGQPFRNALDGCTYQTPFRKAWKLTSGRFKKLEMFCGGLASIFPGTSSVESDFSILKWEKYIHRRSLTDFSLEGVMHARQFKLLQKLKL